jgi:hypothetical protein
MQNPGQTDRERWYSQKYVVFSARGPKTVVFTAHRLMLCMTFGTKNCSILCTQAFNDGIGRICGIRANRQRMAVFTTKVHTIGGIHSIHTLSRI